ncbi:Hypothetical protein Minf_0303 [Methylacidiphilum infernorum V4]|uniref:Uncharacterized protein n=1 Tax=Methylacidiphilum infernorum (isolate V4) TaxID=481448 RepID=B3DY86_METI4|nr:Hypothetical protein Minf_0303 [Methylacidiphilum infernorum V4]
MIFLQIKIIIRKIPSNEIFLENRIDFWNPNLRSFHFFDPSWLDRHRPLF